MNLKDSPHLIKRGELYKVRGVSNIDKVECVAKAQQCNLCDIGYDFYAVDNKHLVIIGDNVSSIYPQFDQNDIEFYEGSHPSI